MRKTKQTLDYHEGFSTNQVRILLQELGYDEKEFNDFLSGQTCPMVPRYNRKGKTELVFGVYEYDFLRWLRHKRYGEKPIFD